ncbi:hypothetical protein BDR26DRAFT_850481 [Obelidium mucronatum]|nr:hypothetical protein BDR26DRAFT_850481 [Obelidium mucronatum]
MNDPLPQATPHHLLLAAHLLRSTAPSLSRHYMRSSGLVDSNTASNTIRRMACSVCGSLFLFGTECSVSVVGGSSSSRKKKPKPTTKRDGIRVRTVELQLNQSRTVASSSSNKTISTTNEHINSVQYHCHVCSAVTVMDGATQKSREAILNAGRHSKSSKQTLVNRQKGDLVPIRASVKVSELHTKPVPNLEPAKAPNTETTNAKPTISSIPAVTSMSKVKKEPIKTTKLKKLLKKSTQKPEGEGGGFSLSDFLL